MNTHVEVTFVTVGGDVIAGVATGGGLGGGVGDGGGLGGGGMFGNPGKDGADIFFNVSATLKFALASITL
jgi:hypothetical protein